MWSLHGIHLMLEVTGGHPFLTVPLQSLLYEIRTEAQRKDNVGQFCCYQNIAHFSIFSTGLKTTNESPDVAREIKI